MAFWQVIKSTNLVTVALIHRSEIGGIIGMKTGKMKGIRFETLESICRVLKCQPGDLLEFTDTDSDE